MNSDQTSRRGFDEPRRNFGGAAEPYLKTAKQAVGGVRDWSSRHLPGGEKTLWIVGGLILLGLFIWWLLPGSQSSAGRFGGMGGPQPVGVAAAKRGSIEVTLNALGTVTPLATVTVRPQVSGQIVRFDFQEGQMVKAGDLLAEIDPRTFQAALSQARGQLDRDSAALANARTDLKRQQGLYAANATSDQALATQQALVKQDEGVVMADQANVQQAAINLGYTRITSPVAGRVGIRLVDVGNFVAAGQTGGIVVVTQMQPISVLFTIREDDIPSVLRRYNAGEHLVVQAYDRTQTTKLATGTLSAVDSQIDTTTGTVKMRAMFDNQDRALFPNQFVNVRLLVQTLKNQVVIPVAAIQRGAQGNFVFVVQPDHTVAMRSVNLGSQQDDNVAVTKGLNSGETVVTDGADRLHDGSEVTIPSGQAVAKVAPATNAGPAPVASGPQSREERRAKMMKACGDDIKKYCASAQGFEMFACLRDHADSLSPACQAVRKQMAHGHGGGGGGGPPPGP